MATPPFADAGNSSGKATEGPKPQEQAPQEGSLRSLLRKSSDFSKDSQRVYHRVDSYLKNRRYVHLQLQDMYTALVLLYKRLFAANWSHFRRTSDALGLTSAGTPEAQKTMAEIYISHWILDLYCSVRECVDNISSVALNEAYSHEMDASSNEYDVFLVALNAAIRPTQIYGCPENVMFIPRFPDDSDFAVGTTVYNPFKLTDFATNFDSFHCILTAIKDKRANFRIACLSTDHVGRPSWLFDWFENNTMACAWFPMEGNFTSHDVAIAYILGVACTPTLAPSDDDSWQQLPDGTNPAAVDVSRIRRILPREVFGDYEVNKYTVKDEKFTIYLKDSDFEGETPVTRKRTRISREERDMTNVGYQTSSSSTTRDPDLEEEVTYHYICLKTYLYYSRVILDDNAVDRAKALAAYVSDTNQYCTI